MTDPVEAKLLTDPQHPDGNVTGTSDAIPVDQVMQLCQELTPEVHKIGFMYTTSEINSQVTTEQAMEAAEQMGYETQLMTISEVSELQQAAQSLAQEVDAIYVPIDNTIAQAMPVLAQVGIDFQIPIYTGADSMVQDGGFATVGINYTQLGPKDRGDGRGGSGGNANQRAAGGDAKRIRNLHQSDHRRTDRRGNPAGDRRDGDHSVVKCG